ncbi:MAG: benzoate-CoA ligase family protein, partial [Betaproteobacteria bacterium]|nr:benzoate-CoA ligase family protein [Betaproteobacteria bacterium]
MVSATPTPFNFAQHLLRLNAGRGDKPAFVDDTEALSYADLASRVQAVSAHLRHLGIRREERVLLLMHDCSDWPVAFLGAMHAGAVPVAVNTLL